MKPGDNIGRYTIVRELGSGGMGVVYVARDPTLERDVALKVLPAATTGDPERRVRLLREAQAAAAVRHRSIATILEVGEHDERVFIAMELVEGQTLADKLKGGALPSGEALRIGAEISRGLARAHEAGVVHRDLKPGNVMLDRDGEVKLLDFGLAKRIDAPSDDDATATALTGAGRVMGTPGYMAPEQASGDEAGPAVDVFALGAVLYEMLTGRAAFAGASTAERLAATLRDDPMVVGDDVPADIAALVAELLAKDPGMRPKSADVSRRLQALVADSATSLARVSAIPRRRSLWKWLAAGAGALALLAAVGHWSGNFRFSLSRPQAESTPEAPVSAADLLGRKGMHLGCPVFEVSGLKARSGAKDVPPEAGRVGAAASTEACNALDEWLGLPLTTKIPAQLLDIAPIGSEETPVAPYLAADVRDKTLAAARALDAVLDGSVRIDENDMHVHLRLIDRAGATLASGEATASLLQIAARSATIALLESAGVPSGALDPDTAAMVGCADGSCLARIALHVQHIRTAAKVSEHCEALAALSPMIAADMAPICGEDGRTADGFPAWPAMLPKSLAAMPPDMRAFWRLALTDQRVSVDEAAKRRAEAEALLARATAPLHAASLSSLRASYAMLSGDHVAARTAYDRTIEIMPRLCNVRGMFNSVTNKAGAPTLGRAATAWCPQVSDLWLVHARLELEREAAADMQGTAYLLSGRAPENATVYAMHLLYVGRTEEVRALASRYLDSGDATARLAGIYIQGRYEFSQGMLGAAIARYRAALLAETPDERTRRPWTNIFDMLFMESILGTSDTVDAVLEKRLIGEPFPEAVRYLGAGFALISLRASPPLRRRALARIRELLRDGRLMTAPDWLPALLDGCEAVDRGDNAAAVAAWRPVLNRDEQLSLPVAPFEAGGEAAIAEKIDLQEIQWYGKVVTLAHAQHAKRLHARGELDAARKLAQRVVDAWGTADVAVPVVADMRALLAER